MNKLKNQMSNVQTLYLKYRPQILDELDLESVRVSLKKIVESGNIPHALLFFGPKGTGKTSAARILAKIANCERRTKNNEPCNSCKQCSSIKEGNNLDVIELDAASHRGIDDVRGLRDAVKLAPAKARKKVYIIDEAHMLTTEASNALLKTLEEPPDHVIFILATTNPEKLIPTIRSRATSILFRKAHEAELVRSLERVVRGEKIKIDKEGLPAIAKASDGSFRDAVKILEQIVSEGKSLKKEEIDNYLFQSRTLDVESILETLAKRDTKTGVDEVEKLVQKGVSMENTIEALIARLKEGLLAEVGVGGKALSGFDKKGIVLLIELLTKAYRELKDSPIEQLPLEIAMVEWGEGGVERSQTAHLDQNSLPDKFGTGSPRSHSRAVAKGDLPTLDSTSENLARTVDPSVRSQAPSQPIGEVSEEVWRRILSTVKPINTSIEALLRAARPIGYDGRNLTLGVFYRFHKERLEEGKNRRILEEVVASILGTPVKIICNLTEPPQKIVVEQKADTVLTEGEDKDIIKIAEEIFGN